MPNEFTLSSIGTRGLVIYEKDGTYYYVSESTWRALGPLNSLPRDFPDAQQLNDLRVVVAALDVGAYIDLDRMPELEPASVQATGNNKVPWTSGQRSVVFKENNALYQVSTDNWKPIPVGFEGDAGVMIKRGAVAATIPSNSIPSGTYCVLVNLDNLK